MLGLLNKFIENREKARQEALILCNEYMEKISTATKEYDTIFIDKGKYVDIQAIYVWFDKWCNW